MRLIGLTAPALLLAASLVEGQGIQFEKIYQKKPALAKASNSKTASVNTHAIAASITDKLNKLKGVATKSSAIAKSTAKSSSTLSPKRAGFTSSRAVQKSSITTKEVPSIPTTVPKVSVKLTKPGTAKQSPASTKHKRAAAAVPSSACTPQNIQFGYQPSPNDAMTFIQDGNLGNWSFAQRNYPAGYSNVFSNGFASVQGLTYRGLFQLPTYDAFACAAYCDADPSCASFNIFFERDPTADPGASCGNPTAATMVKCTLWANPITTAAATNIGEWRTNFMVVISGSNAFNKDSANSLTPATPAGFTAISLGGAIDVSTSPLKPSYLNAQFFPQAYNPQPCADFCTSTTTTNKAAAVAAGQSYYTACNFFNALAINLNGAFQGTYCQLYSTDVRQYAGLYNTTSNSVFYNLGRSYGFVANTWNCGTLSTSGSCVAPSIVTTRSGAVATPTPSGNLGDFPGAGVTIRKSTTYAGPVTAPVGALPTLTGPNLGATPSKTTTTLTSATPSPRSCAALGSSSYADLNGITYNVLCNADLNGYGDVGSTEAAGIWRTFTDCFTLCDVKGTCNAFALNNGNCYFKNVTGVTAGLYQASWLGVDFAWLPIAYPPGNSLIGYTTTTMRTSMTTTTTTTTTPSGLIPTPTTAPLYIQLGGGSSVQGMYLGVQSSSAGDALTFVSSTANAAKFVINTNTGLVYEYNNNVGNIFSINFATNALTTGVFSRPVPAANSPVACVYSTANNWITCSSSAGLLVAYTCNSDGNVYWSANSVPSSCQWLQLTPVSAPS